MSVERLFTDYADALNSGKQVKKEEYFARCPEADREELRGLIEMLAVFQRSVIPVKTNIAEEDVLFAHLEERRKARNKNAPFKSVSNFNAEKDLTGDIKKKVDDKIDKIWAEEFGED